MKVLILTGDYYDSPGELTPQLKGYIGYIVFTQFNPRHIQNQNKITLNHLGKKFGLKLLHSFKSGQITVIGYIPYINSNTQNGCQNMMTRVHMYGNI